MTKTEQTLKETKVLYGWDGMDVLPNVEEDPNDIWLLIEYVDHGDHFLVVGTKDGKFYEYGLYFNRERSTLFGSDYYFNGIRRPKLYKIIKSRETADVSNKIFWEFDRAFSETRHCNFDKKYYSETYAQSTFDMEICFISGLASSSEALFDYSKYKKNIARWLELNNIATDQNIKKLNETRFDNKIGEYRVVGEAGKKEIKNYYIYGDEIKYIIVNNKTIDPNKVTSYAGSDEWGVDSISLSLRGFRPSK